MVESFTLTNVQKQTGSAGDFGDISGKVYGVARGLFRYANTARKSMKTGRGYIGEGGKKSKLITKDIGRRIDNDA